jgi:hypothetical protein
MSLTVISRFEARLSVSCSELQLFALVFEDERPSGSHLVHSRASRFRPRLSRPTPFGRAGHSAAAVRSPRGARAPLLEPAQLLLERSAARSMAAAAASLLAARSRAL